jgi:hypothetical protein
MSSDYEYSDEEVDNVFDDDDMQAEGWPYIALGFAL